ncbi:histidine phosphatase family protein, partial [Bacillus paranthracis]
MKKIIVIRHCSAAGQERHAELTTDGKKQANTLATFLLENQLQI